MDPEHMPQPLPGSGASLSQSPDGFTNRWRDEKSKGHRGSTLVESTLSHYQHQNSSHAHPTRNPWRSEKKKRRKKNPVPSTQHRHIPSSRLSRCCTSIHPSSQPSIFSSRASFVDPLAHRLVASRGIAAFEMTALGFAVVYEQVDGRGARFDQGPAPELQETEEQYEHHQLHDEFFDDLCTLLFGGLQLVTYTQRSPATTIL
jgi:hypothetical protein